jgi:hypothetical protein
MAISKKIGFWKCSQKQRKKYGHFNSKPSEGKKKAKG